jgi:hypothetical protein
VTEKIIRSQDESWSQDKVVCDSKSAIDIANNHVQHDRTKHALLQKKKFSNDFFTI